MRRFVAIMLAVFVVLSIVAACANDPAPAPAPAAPAAPPTPTPPGAPAATPPTPTPPPPAPDARIKDTIIYAHNTDAVTLDPQRANDTHSMQIVRMIYNTMFEFDDYGIPQPSLATGHSVSDDQLSWTFTLRQDAVWHCGTPFTSADVVATFERAMFSPDRAALRTTEVINMFTSVVADDEFTVTITTEEPYGPMLSLMCNSFLAIMNKGTIERFGLDIGLNLETINGTGHFILAEWVAGDRIVVERRPDNTNPNVLTQRVIYQVIPDATARVIALENGEVDAIGIINAEDVPLLKANPNITVNIVPSVGQRLFRFGCNDPIMQCTLVRRALNIAVDRQSIIDALFPGVAYPVTSALAPVTFGYHTVGVIEQDQARARELLAEAGFPDGFNTKIITTVRYPRGIELAEILAAQFAEIGVIAEIEVWEWAALTASWDGLTREEFDQPIFIMGAGPSMRDADGGLRGLYTTTERYNDRNYGFYSNAEVDYLVFAGMRETCQQRRLELYARAQEILFYEDPAGIWLFNQMFVTAFSANLHGVETTAISQIKFRYAWYALD